MWAKVAQDELTTSVPASCPGQTEGPAPGVFSVGIIEELLSIQGSSSPLIVLLQAPSFLDSVPSSPQFCFFQPLLFQTPLFLYLDPFQAAAKAHLWYLVQMFLDSLLFPTLD